MNDGRQTGMANNKYKTALCKHFSMTGNCPKKNECAFAHGDHELQGGMTAQIKPFKKMNSMATMMQNPMQNNYKSQLCRYYDQETGQCNCKYESKCNFAHSKEELRERLDKQAYKNRKILIIYNKDEESNNEPYDQCPYAI